MKEFTIKINSVDKVKEFVSITSKYQFDIDLCHERYVIDAKSIMGIFSLDISKPLTIKAHCEDCEDFEEKIKSFLV